MIFVYEKIAHLISSFERRIAKNLGYSDGFPFSHGLYTYTLKYKSWIKKYTD